MSFEISVLNIIKDEEGDVDFGKRYKFRTHTKIIRDISNVVAEHGWKKLTFRTRRPGEIKRRLSISGGTVPMPIQAKKIDKRRETVPSRFRAPKELRNENNLNTLDSLMKRGPKKTDKPTPVTPPTPLNKPAKKDFEFKVPDIPFWCQKKTAPPKPDVNVSVFPNLICIFQNLM